MGVLRAFFGLVGADRRVAVASLMFLGAGLALVSGYYANSGAPPEAKGGPPETPFDATGSLAVGSLHGEDAAAEEIERAAKDARKAEAKPREAAAEVREEPARTARAAGATGSGGEIEEPAPNALQGLSEEEPPAEPARSEAPQRAEPQPRPAPQREAAPEAAPDPEPRPVAQAAPEPEPRWSVPADKTLYLTIPKMANVSGTPAFDAAGDDEGALAAGTIHLKGTGFPWEGEANVYIAGHRIGYPGTRSDKVFYDLDVLGAGDEVVVEDSTGRSYSYRVFDTSRVEADALTVANPHPGKNTLTLQTCTLPDYSDRLLIHAERV